MKTAATDAGRPRFRRDRGSASPARRDGRSGAPGWEVAETLRGQGPAKFPSPRLLPEDLVEPGAGGNCAGGNCAVGRPVVATGVTVVAKDVAALEPPRPASACGAAPALAGENRASAANTASAATRGSAATRETWATRATRAATATGAIVATGTASSTAARRAPSGRLGGAVRDRLLTPRVSTCSPAPEAPIRPTTVVGSTHAPHRRPRRPRGPAWSGR